MAFVDTPRSNIERALRVTQIIFETHAKFRLPHLKLEHITVLLGVDIFIGKEYFKSVELEPHAEERGYSHPSLR
jgi:hypothetical protein